MSASVFHNVYYDRPTRCWWGYWADANGCQLIDAVNACSKDECLIELGTVRSDAMEIARERAA